MGNPAIPSYSITDLGVLPSGRISVALGIDATGAAVGSADTAAREAHAFLYQGSDLRDLGTLGGKNSAAAALERVPPGRGSDVLVVGNSETPSGATRAFYWYTRRLLVSGPQDLGSLGGHSSFATDINAARVVGAAETASGTMHAFLVVLGGAMEDLGTLGGRSSLANGINSPGQVIGAAETASAAIHAFLADPGSPLQDLGTLGGKNSVAYGLNAEGAVVGGAETAGGAGHAFLAQGAPGGGVMQDLGTLGGRNSVAFGINAAGQVVGASENAGGATHAFLFSGSLLNLNSLLPPDSGWELTRASAINDAGQIVGTGKRQSRLHAFLLTPSRG
jgi:probable HAF family extracellular repeat protein